MTVCLSTIIKAVTVIWMNLLFRLWSTHYSKTFWSFSHSKYIYSPFPNRSAEKISFCRRNEGSSDRLFTWMSLLFVAEARPERIQFVSKAFGQRLQSAGMFFWWYVFWDDPSCLWSVYHFPGGFHSWNSWSENAASFLSRLQLIFLWAW